MTPWTPYALLAIGLVLLLVGAEALVRGASRLATRLGIAPLVVGLTVVAFGTSAPELAVSVQSSVGGQADLALGNVVGSNIFNVLFILGVSAVAAPLVVSDQLVRLDVPLMIGVSVVVLLLALDGRLGRLEGSLLVLGIVVYTALQIRIGLGRGSKNGPQSEPGEGGGSRSVAVDLVWVLAGLAALVLGARWLVAGAVEIAVAFACLPIFFTGSRIDRWEGVLFLGYYGAYTGYLGAHAVDHPVVPAFRTAMAGFVLPLTAVTLLVIVWRARRARTR